MQLYAVIRHMLSIGKKYEKISAMSAYHRSLSIIFNVKKQSQVVVSFYLKTFHLSKNPIPTLEELRVKYQKIAGKLSCKFSVSTSWGRLS